MSAACLHVPAYRIARLRDLVNMSMEWETCLRRRGVLPDQTEAQLIEQNWCSKYWIEILDSLLLRWWVLRREASNLSGFKTRLLKDQVLQIWPATWAISMCHTTVKCILKYCNVYICFLERLRMLHHIPGEHCSSSSKSNHLAFPEVRDNQPCKRWNSVSFVKRTVLLDAWQPLPDWKLIMCMHILSVLSLSG